MECDQGKECHLHTPIHNKHTHTQTHAYTHMNLEATVTKYTNEQIHT